MSEEVEQNMIVLTNIIKVYNITSASLRDVLRSSIPIPFHPDPLLTVSLTFEEPIMVDKFISIEIFNKQFVEISGVRLLDQEITFYFNSEDGEDSIEYTFSLHDNINDIELWQYYLLAKAAPKLKEYIEGEHEEAKKFINFLIETMQKIQEKRNIEE